MEEARKTGGWRNEKRGKIRGEATDGRGER